MKCPNCGNEIKEGNKFCGYCGTQTSINMYSNVGQSQKQVYSQNQMHAKKEHSQSNMWLWILGWLFIFPLPLTIVLIKYKNMEQALKYVFIVLAWVFYIGICCAYSPSNKSNEPNTEISSEVNTQTTTEMEETTEEPTTEEPTTEESTTEKKLTPAEEEKELEAVEGKTLLAAKKISKKLGYEASYYDKEWGMDRTEQVKKYGKKKKKKFIVQSVDVDTWSKEVTFNYKSKKTIELEERLSPSTAWEALSDYGKAQCPYGFKVHSIMGRIAQRREGDEWFLKSEVTITNVFGAKYKTVVEGRVGGTDDNPQISYFYVYD